jgi:hypothetical protein
MTSVLLGSVVDSRHAEADHMAQFLTVKVEYEDKPRKIKATDVKEENGKLHIFDGEKKVGEFPVHKIEHWSFTEEETAF